MSNPLTLREAIIEVLRQAQRPLKAHEIAQALLEQKLWSTEGKTPEASISSLIYRDIQHHGEGSQFVKVKPATFALRSRGTTTHKQVKKAKSTFTFLDAAERVLKAHGRPMHYRAITDEALQKGWIATQGKTPEATMYAQILTDIRRRQSKGLEPRFIKSGKGLVALARDVEPGIEKLIQTHNQKVREKLRENLSAMDWGEFEELVAQLLVEMGFEEVDMTPRKRDGGIDVRGTLVIAEAIRVRIAAQVKRWENNVPAPIIQQVRGSLGAHEQGLIVTTGGFSKGARREASRSDAAPVALIDGDQLIDLLSQYEIGVHRKPLYLLDLESKSDE